MSRLTLLRLLWLIAFLALTSAAFLVWLASGQREEVLVGLAIALLIPGRIQGYFFRDLFTARRLMDRGLHGEALAPLNAFMDRVRQRPAYRFLVWLAWPGYSISPLAMALNNRGACHLALEDLTAAEADFQQAIEEDPKSPLPFVNLGLLHAMRGEGAESERAFQHAAELGFTGGRLDQMQMRAASALAAVEGKNVASRSA